MIQKKSHKTISLFDASIIGPAIIDSFRKLNPCHQIKNPVMFVVLVGSVLTTGLYLQAIFGRGEAPSNFILAISLWLWFTVIFANFAEAMAEGRGKAQAATLRKARRDTLQKNFQNRNTVQAFILYRL
jgi:K+-transporting ATPase ATPase B chain